MLQPKQENFQIKKIWYFSYFCSKHRLWVRQVYYIKIGCKGRQFYIGMFFVMMRSKIVWKMSRKMYIERSLPMTSGGRTCCKLNVLIPSETWYSKTAFSCWQISRYENTPIQIYWKFHHKKNWKFSDKNSDIFHISAQNIDCRYSLEPPRF